MAYILLLASAASGCGEQPKMPSMPWQKPPALPEAPPTHVMGPQGAITAVNPVPGTPEGDSELVRRRLVARQFDQAYAEGEAALVKYAGDETIREDLLLWVGEAEIGRKNYYEAYERFEKLLNDYPDGRYRGRALSREYEVADKFLLGAKRRTMKILWVSGKDEAIKILEGIADHAPNTAIAQKALMRIADYYYTDKKYSDAVASYDRFLQMFPKAPQAAYASYQAARACRAMYIGVLYDETPLRDAKQRLLDYQESFPVQAREQQVYLQLETIQTLLAEKTYTIGQYYEKTRPSPERKRAAAYYYQQTVREFPTTAWAQRARQSLSRLGIAAPTSPGLPPPNLYLETQRDTQKEGRAPQ
ncbi:MAG: outer membrane protein assembly factor BamD [Planctomycetota bacterium]